MRPKLWLLWMYVVILFAIYWVSSSGIVSSVDGSHYALVRAIAENGTWAIDDFIETTHWLDYASKDGHAYSDRPPGTAFLAVPLYLLSKQLWPVVPANPAIVRVPKDSRIDLVLVLPALSAAVAMLLVIVIATRYLAVAWSAAWLAALALALGTPIWKFASALYSHSISMLVVLAILFITWRLRSHRSPLALFALGWLWGFSTLVEYPNLLIGLPILCYLAWCSYKQSLRPMLSTLAWVGAGAALPLAGLAYYNWVAFGDPLKTGYTYHAFFEWAHRLETMFVTPLLEGLGRMLLAVPHSLTANDGLEFEGLFVAGPFLLLAIWGFGYFWREHRAEAVLSITIVVILWLAHAKHISAISRYLSTTIPLLGLGVALWIDRFLKHRTGSNRIFWFAIFFVLCAWSVLNTAFTIGTFWAHARVPGTWELDSALPLWLTLFPNVSFFLPLIVTLTLAPLAAVGTVRVMQRLWVRLLAITWSEMLEVCLPGIAVLRRYALGIGVLGLLVASVSLEADAIGIGGTPGLGLWQIGGGLVGLGLVTLAVGVRLYPQVAKPILFGFMAATTIAYWSILIFQVPIFQSLRGWFWRFIPKPLDAGWLLIVVGLFSYLVISHVLTYPERKSTLLLLVLLGYVIQMSFGFMENRGIDGIRERLVKTGHAEFAVTASKETDFLKIATHYEELLKAKKLGDFANSKPPGQLLFFMATQQISGLFAPGSLPQDRYEALITFASHIYPLLTYLVIVPLFYFAKRFMPAQQALFPVILYLFIPNVTLVTLHLDQVLYPLLVVICLVLATHAYQADNLVLAFFSGSLIYLSIYISFSLLSVIPLTLLFILAQFLFKSDQGQWFRLFKIISSGAAGILTTAVLFQVFLNYDVLLRYGNAMSFHETWKSWESSLENILYSAGLDYLELAVWVGVPMVFLYGGSLFETARNILFGKTTVADAFSISFLLVLLALGLLSHTRGEVARLWIFLVPLICLLASKGLSVFFNDQVLGIKLIAGLQLLTIFVIKGHQDFW